MMKENNHREDDSKSDTVGADDSGQQAVEYHLPDDSSGFLLAEQAAFWINEIKGEDVVILDLRDRSDVCDFFVIASGLSDVQVKAIGKAVQNNLHTVGQKPMSSEGANEGRWFLIDYFDVVIHIQRPEVRQYYRLESLWSDAPRLEIPPTWFFAPEVRKRQPDLPVREGTAAISNPKESDPS